MPPPAAFWPTPPIAWLPATTTDFMLRLPPLLYTAPPLAVDPVTRPPVSVRFCSVRVAPVATSNRRNADEALLSRKSVALLPSMVMVPVMTGKALLVAWYGAVKSKVAPEAKVIVVAPPALLAALMSAISWAVVFGVA